MVDQVHDRPSNDVIFRQEEKRPRIEHQHPEIFVNHNDCILDCSTTSLNTVRSRAIVLYMLALLMAIVA